MRNRIVAASTAAVVMSLLALPAVASAAASSTEQMPAGLRPALYAALAKDAGPTRAIGKDGCATLARQQLTACFTKDGVQFHGKGAPPLTLHLAGYGRGSRLTPVSAVVPKIEAKRASYAHGDVTEWWRVLPMGFEQGFTVAKRPAGQGDLTLALAANRKASTQGKDLAWGKLDYGKLVVTDAKGRVVPAKLEHEGSRILIAVDDTHAAYPLTVDPMVWIEQKVTASDGEDGDLFGLSVAASGDTALVGAPYATVNDLGNAGAVYVFTEADGVWTQTQRLNASDYYYFGNFGTSVAIDGQTALVGAIDGYCDYNFLPGEAYIFTRSNGVWTQTQELSTDGDCVFGSSVALEGSTALVGDIGATVSGHSGAGAVHVFGYDGVDWSESQILTSSNVQVGENFGAAIALDGGTALIGAPGSYNGRQGTAYVFGDTGGTWAQVQELTAGDGTANDRFGSTVGLSGAVAVVGAPFADTGGNTNEGAAYVFEQSDGTWSQTQELTAPDGFAYLLYGKAVAASDGRIIVGAQNANVGGHTSAGAAYLYDDNGGTWTLQHSFTASDAEDGALFGSSVVFDGASALIGARFDGGSPGPGAAYFYAASDLGLALSAPGSVSQGQDYVTQAIATNDATSATPAAVTVTVAVPAAATFVSATASQGSCSNAGGTVTCALGQIAANGGTATANVTFAATGNVGTTIENAAGVAKATPALTAGAATEIAQSNCAAGYTEYDGTLAAYGRVIEPDGQPYQAAAGQENGVLTAPAGFSLAVAYRGAGGSWHVYPAPGGELHRYGPAGSYAWIVKSGATGGSFTLCLKHP